VSPVRRKPPSYVPSGRAIPFSRVLLRIHDSRRNAKAALIGRLDGWCWDTPPFYSAETGSIATKDFGRGQDGLKKVAIPSPANVTWDENGKRIVVGSHGGVYSYINPETGEKDITPSFPKILVETPQDEKLVREALANVAPYILDLPNFVDNFYSYPRAEEFKRLIETNYPGVKFDDLLQAIKTTSIKNQERSLAILAIGNPDKLRREYPGQFPKISDNTTQFYWNGRLNNSPINMPLKWMRDPSELHGGFLKEYFSLIAGEAIKTNSKLYQASIAGRINSVTYFTYMVERFGAYAFVQDFSGLGVSIDRQRRIDYSFKPDSEMIFR